MSSQIRSLGQGGAAQQWEPRVQASPIRVEPATSDLELFVRMSYGNLIKDGKGALGKGAGTIAVYLSRFRKGLQAIDAAETDEVADDFVNDVEAFIERVTGALEAAGESTAQVSAPIKAWRNAYLALVRGAGLPQDFSGALNVVIGRCEDRDGRPISIKSVAQEAGVPYDSLRDWLTGRHEPAYPHQATRLEQALELKPGVLLSRLSNVKRTSRPRIKTSVWPQACRGDRAKALRGEIVKRLGDDFYALPTALQTQVLEGHRLEILAEKAKRAASRNPWVPKDGRWPGVTEEDWNGIQAWYSEVQGKKDRLRAPMRGERKDKAPGGWRSEKSVRTYRNRLAGMAGWLGAWQRGDYVVPPPGQYEAPSELPQMRALLGEAPVSLALFVDSRLVHEFVRFRMRLSDDPTENSFQAITTMQMLLREGRGYLRLRPEKWERIPEKLREDILAHYELEPEEGTPSERVWDMVCEAAGDDLAELAEDHKEMLDPARGFADIMPILELDNPVKVLKRMHEDVRADMQLARGGDHDWLATALALSELLAWTCLRRGHYAKLTYREDNTGLVRIEEDGRVTVRALVKHFKNRHASRFKTMKQDAEILLPLNNERVQEALRYYLLEVRPRLAPRGSDAFLVVPSTGVPITDEYVSQVVYSLTDRYIAEGSDKGQRLPGQKKFGPHKYRHIVATELVKKFKELKPAARFLRASMRVVEKNYALFLPTDEVASIEEDLAAIWD